MAHVAHVDSEIGCDPTSCGHVHGASVAENYFMDVRAARR
jgi:hypothetical protein